MEKRWEEIYNYLSSQTYPEGYDKSEKQTLRRFASKFKIRDGELWSGRQRVVKTREEAKTIFAQFHSSPIGGHTGIIKTRHAISSRFYWYGMTVDIENWVLECEKCQKVGKPLAVDQKLNCIQVHFDSLARMEIACALLKYRGNAEDYCVVCSMLECDAEQSMIEMVQCDLCGRWAHFECATYQKDLPAYVCRKCREI